MTTIHALITFIISLTFYLTVSSKLDQFDKDLRFDRLFGLFNMMVGGYCVMIVLLLTFFSIYNISLLVKNTTSNESLRDKWNVKHAKSNVSAAELSLIDV